jgi:hypothetical protein
MMTADNESLWVARRERARRFVQSGAVCAASWRCPLSTRPRRRWRLRQ